MKQRNVIISFIRNVFHNGWYNRSYAQIANKKYIWMIGDLLVNTNKLRANTIYKYNKIIDTHPHI